jgi:hypothetical protein
VKTVIVKQYKQRQVILLKVLLNSNLILNSQSLFKVNKDMYFREVFNNIIGQPYFVKQHSQITNFRRDTSVPDSTALTCVHSFISAISREEARLISANKYNSKIIVTVDLRLKKTLL